MTGMTVCRVVGIKPGVRFGKLAKAAVRPPPDIQIGGKPRVPIFERHAPEGQSNDLMPGLQIHEMQPFWPKEFHLSPLPPSRTKSRDLRAYSKFRSEATRSNCKNIASFVAFPLHNVLKKIVEFFQVIALGEPPMQGLVLLALMLRCEAE